MNDIKRKLTSRKLWLALAGVATGVFLALGGDASEIQTVAGSITALASALAYILTEGKIDAAAVRKEKTRGANFSSKGVETRRSCSPEARKGALSVRTR